MNYIKHLNAVFQQFAKDSRLNPTHVSLYMVLFQYWNMNRFPESFLVNREETMTLSKIGSATTYHKCISNLSDWKYIVYLPSHNRFKGSRIMMPTFGTIPEQDVDRHETDTEQAVVSYINSNKHNKTNNKLSRENIPNNEQVVLEFFKTNNWPYQEATKFYNYYQGLGWKVGGKSPIEDWHSTARSWMLKSKEMKQESGFIGTSNKRPKEDYLKTSKDKNYGQPL